MKFAWAPITGAVAAGIALQPRAGIAALVVAIALGLLVRVRYAMVVLVVFVTAAQFGLRVDAAPGSSAGPSRPVHHR